MLGSPMRQHSLFNNSHEDMISIDEAAGLINVSSATIRNWIKTGYLNQIGKNIISLDSFNEFKEKVAGTDKLVARANKSKKDQHDQNELSDVICRLVDDDSYDSSLLGENYESMLSETHKNNEGIYYTPEFIAKRFFENIPEDCSELTFCDPCCGSGNFLLAALRKGFKLENIYGFDIDPVAIKIANRRLRDSTGLENTNIICKDFLAGPSLNDCKQYDVIITNPPWGKKISKEIKDGLSAALGSKLSKDTSSLFFFKCLKTLNKNGILGLLLQDAFFNIAAFEDSRKKALSLKINELIDFGKPFKGLLTKARGIILQNKPNNDTESKVLCETSEGNHYRPQASFKSNPKSILNFTFPNESADVVRKMYEVNHVLLDGNARFGLGIVTGNNERHCSEHQKEGLIPVYKGADISEDGLKQPTCYISKDFSQYQQVAPIALYMAKEKLIYRFISSDLVFYFDDQQRFILNSANMLVLNDNFPINTYKLSKLLNSRIMNSLFKCMFETHKVLKADIESLPIHVGYYDLYEEFSEERYLSYLGIEEISGGTYRVKS